jgi:STE24 endopeptidase
MIHFNPLLLTFLALFVLRSATQVVLHRLNISFLRREGDRVPDVFQDIVDREKLKTISTYTVDSAKISMAATLFNQAVLIFILLSGILPWLAETIHHWGLGEIAGGLAFFAILSIVTHLLSLPFSLYDTFVIEDRYGFNTMTFWMWVSDLAKGLALSAVLGGLVLWGLLALVVQGGPMWWVWAWIFLGLFELLLLWLFPLVIAPLFNKFEPVENKDLEQQIETLMGKVGLRVKGVFKMDASKRSKHTNAYFTGVGRSKRIVLFDTLLESHAGEEILAVLAHEIGHWKKKHMLRQLLLVEIMSLAGLYAAARFLDWPLLYETFGFQEVIPYVGLFLIGTGFSLMGYFSQPLESAISRRFEREADDFSLTLMKVADPLVRALKRLATDNLSNLNPHPVYAWFYYSHPPLAERIERLKKVGRREGAASGP